MVALPWGESWNPTAEQRAVQAAQKLAVAAREFVRVPSRRNRAVLEEIADAFDQAVTEIHNERRHPHERHH